jgi:pyruvate formate lyase activating enzyme
LLATGKETIVHEDTPLLAAGYLQLKNSLIAPYVCEGRRERRGILHRTLANEAPAIADGGNGWFSNFQDFVVHDGPGLRVLVFLRGCPLNCSWCQNPESLELSPQIEFHKTRCIGCGRCAEICPVPGAILKDGDQRIDRSKCTKCMACVDVCLGKALRKIGEQISVEQVIKKVLPYKPFFDNSDRGGVTLSGGEPAFQPEFTSKLLQAFQEKGIHTALETCGCISYETLKKIVQNVDVLIYDIKHMDDAAHTKGTGRSNRLILDNLSRLCKEDNKEIIVHVPLVPGFNDDEENIRKTAEFVKSLKTIKKIDLLPFNDLAAEKYTAMGLNWEYDKTKQQLPEHLKKLKEIVESYGLEVTLGGLR